MIKFKNHHSRRKGIKSFQKEARRSKQKQLVPFAVCTPVNDQAHFIEEASESPGNPGTRARPHV